MSRRTRVRWSEVTALFGGTFDPPHLGHRAAVAGLFTHPGVSRVLVLPSPRPPHKPTIAPEEERVALTRLAFGASPGFPLRGPVEIDLREIERAKRNPGQPTYTYDTLCEMRRETPHLAFVIGTDQLQKLHLWNRFPDLLGLSHWIVLVRKGHGSAEEAQKVMNLWESSGLVRADGDGWRATSTLGAGKEGSGFIQLLDTPAPEISSTAIRESLIRAGKPPENTLLPEVFAYLMHQGLYGTRVPYGK